MGKYIIKRLLWMIPVIIGVLTIAFILNEASPGDPAQMLAGSDATPEQIEAMRIQLGLNQPAIARYFNYLIGVFTRLDLGTSYVSNMPVLGEILTRFPFTFKLACLSILFACVVGIPLGVIAAVKQYSILDNITMTIALLGVSIPPFWLGLMLIQFLSVKAGILPGSGITSWQSWILPVFANGFSATATIARITRSSMLDVIRQDYMRTAEAKGQKALYIIIVHGLRNAMIPVLTTIGSQFGVQLGGAIIVENVFSLPGLGSYMLAAIKAQNYPVVQGGVIFLAVVYSIVNLLVDLLYTVVDPQLKTMFASKGRRAARKAMNQAIKEGSI